MCPFHEKKLSTSVSLTVINCLAVVPVLKSVSKGSLLRSTRRNGIQALDVIRSPFLSFSFFILPLATKTYSRATGRAHVKLRYMRDAKKPIKECPSGDRSRQLPKIKQCRYSEVSRWRNVFRGVSCDTYAATARYIVLWCLCNRRSKRCQLYSEKRNFL